MENNKKDKNRNLVEVLSQEMLPILRCLSTLKPFIIPIGGHSFLNDYSPNNFEMLCYGLYKNVT